MAQADGEGSDDGARGAPAKNGRARKGRRFSGKASEGPDRSLTLTVGVRSGGVAGAMKKADREDGWTPERRTLFMETLAATCNVSEAARKAGKDLSGAYYKRRRDAGFAREWEQALAIGYAELEGFMLRQVMFGSEAEDVMLDGEGAVKGRKIRREHPLGVGVRLLLAHQAQVARTRGDHLRERPDGDDAVERVRAVLEAIRARRAAEGG